MTIAREITRPVVPLGALTALALIGAPSPAFASHPYEDGGPSLPPTAQAERKLQAFETRTLGADHAAEHALQRRALRRQQGRWRRLSPAQRRRRAAAAKRRGKRRQRVTQGPEAQVGAWTTAPFPIPYYAIHSVVLPTGKVLFWGYDPRGPGGTHVNHGLAALWDPAKGTGGAAFKLVPPPLVDADGNGTLEPAPIYCSGQSLMATGEVLVAGGNRVWPGQSGGTFTNFAGTKQVLTFNPFTETWTPQPTMRFGRWYPTQVELADGRSLIASGYTEKAPGGDYNKEVEIFTPGSGASSVGSVSHPVTADRFLSLYPHLFLLPTGSVLAAGPGIPNESALLNTQTMTWQQLGLPSQQRYRATAVLVPGGPQGSFTAMQIGGTDDRLPKLPDGTEPATATTESINASVGAPVYGPTAPMNVARANHNTVLLPDGSMVTIGGGRGYDPANLGGYITHPDGRARRVELWDPATRTWRLGPAQLEDRAYHSTAVLLPDGRVMSAGDDYSPSNPAANGGFSTSDTAELYSPPYLFQPGRRPEIKSAPASAAWGQSFKVEVKKPRKRRRGAAASARKRKGKGGSPEKTPPPARAVLMAPDATTHANDMHQRHVELQVVRRLKGRKKAGLMVTAPPTAGVAPPGYYMLFVLNTRGEPSVARWIKLTPNPVPEPRKKGKKKKKRKRG
jgi:hypothetical protein